MKKVSDNNWNKVVEYIDSLKNQNPIKPSELSKIININKDEIENVFKSLHEQGKVIDLTGTELEISITKDKKVDYSSLLKNERHIRYKLKNKHINTAIGILGLIIALVIAYLQGAFDSIIDYIINNKSSLK